MSRRNLAVLVAVAVAATAVAAPVVAQSSGGQTITFRELDKGSRFGYIDNPPRNSKHKRPVFSVGANIRYSMRAAVSIAKFG